VRTLAHHDGRADGEGGGARAGALGASVDGALAELSRQVDLTNPDSELVALHTPLAQQPRRADPPPPRGTVSQGTALLVQRALAVAVATEGAFDPPRPASPWTTVTRPTFRRLAVDGGRLRLDGYDVVVDLGAVVDAAAAAALARVVEEHGFADAAVAVADDGSDVFVRGGHARATARRPAAGALDPRDGALVTTGPLSCTVAADDAVVAAGLAQACLVLGAEGVRAAAATLGAHAEPTAP